YDSAAAFLESPCIVPALDAMYPEMAGTHLGPWRIVSELGRGGMGAVFLAQRDDAQFEKRVAIKMIADGGLTGELQRRFESERQILASLEPPNTAQLWDAGRTESGLSYIVMEYVEGLPIPRHCGERKLGLRERLELFEAVCSAVAFAHQRLVVHRD